MRTNAEKIREVAATLGTISESVLHELDYGDFTFDDLMWFEERVKSETSNLTKLVNDFLGVDKPSQED